MSVHNVCYLLKRHIRRTAAEEKLSGRVRKRTDEGQRHLRGSRALLNRADKKVSNEVLHCLVGSAGELFVFDVRFHSVALLPLFMHGIVMCGTVMRIFRLTAARMV